MTENSELKLSYKGGGSIIDHPAIFSSDGCFIYIPWRNLLRCYNVATGERIADLDGCDDIIVGAAIHPQNPKLLVGCSSSAEIAVWRWDSKLLISKNKLKANIDKVFAFHLISSREIIQGSESEDCKMLIRWSNSGVFCVGTFFLNKLVLCEELSIFSGLHSNKIAVGGNNSSSHFIAAIEKNYLYCLSLEKSTTKTMLREKSDFGTNFSCLACHPEQFCVATGDTKGRIVLWYNLFGSGPPLRSSYHWHSLPVTTLAFSHSGTVLYSGAEECVMVKWSLNTLNRDFLPRLPAPIVQLSCAPNNIHVAISMQSNAIHVVDSQLAAKTVIQHLTWYTGPSVGIKGDRRTKALVLNGHVGNVQFYQPHSATLLYNLDIVGQNKITREQDLDIPNTNVTKLALTRDSDWLASVEERCDKNGVYHEIRLKFFHFDLASQKFSLNTSVEFPHENGVNDLEFQPSSNSTSLLCATCGNDNQFKIWNLIDTTTIYRKSKAWRCSSSGYYKNLPAKALSFSTDGSLMGVAFGPCVTAWSPETYDLKCSLVHPSFKAMLNTIQFGNVDQSHLIVTGSADRMSVWNLLTLALVWTVPIRVVNLCTDPLSTYMAVITSDSSLFVFAPGFSTPIYFKKNIVENSEKIIASAFIPNTVEKTVGPTWQKMSQLYLLSSKQELLCLESDGEKLGVHPLEYSSQTQRSAFSAMLAETVTSSRPKHTEQITHMDTGLTGATEIKQLLEPPVHTMAPMRLLCGSVLRSLVLKDNNSKLEDDKNENDNDDKLDSDLNDDADTESEEDETDMPKRRAMKVPNRKSEDEPSSAKKKENLQAVLKESVNWASILLD